MYNETAIQAIIDRIGWKAPIEVSGVTLTQQNVLSNSGRSTESFHRLVTVQNVYNTVPMANMAKDVFNAVLYDYKRQAVLQILLAIFDENELAYYQTNNIGIRTSLNGADYSDNIIRFISVFDRAYGIQLAIDVLQMMRSSARSNTNERPIKEFQSIPTDIEGSFSPAPESKMIVKGLRSQLQDAIQKAIEILFPQDKKGVNILRDASFKW